MSIKKSFFLLIAITLLPEVSSAQNLNFSSFSALTSSLLKLIGGTLVPTLVSMALLLFFWRIVVSLYQVGENHEAVGEKKMILVWGVIALFVMVSLWGIVRVFTNTVGITPVIPQLQNFHK